MSPGVALIVGAIAQRFARGGLTVCAVRRDADKLQPLLAEIRAAGGTAHGFGSDARKEEQVVSLVEQVETTVGPIEVLVFNIGANVRTPVVEENARRYQDARKAPSFMAGTDSADSAAVL